LRNATSGLKSNFRWFLDFSFEFKVRRGNYKKITPLHVLGQSFGKTLIIHASYRGSRHEAIGGAFIAYFARGLPVTPCQSPKGVGCSLYLLGLL
jgi:hypothetical protein